jgi:hypothetical protein
MRSLASGTPTREDDAPTVEPQRAPPAATTITWVTLWPKLAVSTPDDPHEREADRVADAMADGVTGQATGAGAGGGTGRADEPMPCTECTEATRVQRSASGRRSPTAPAGPLALGPGQPLDGGVRARMEPLFRTEFASVRVHTSSEAAHAARSLDAHALTVGADIAFAAGRYAPETQEGQRLLAHELTHVVQRRSGSSPATVSRQADPAAVDASAVSAIADKVRDNDVAGVVTELSRHRGEPSLGALRTQVGTAIGQRPERWLLSKGRQSEAVAAARGLSLVGAALPVVGVPAAVLASVVPTGQDAQRAEQGIRILWPVLSLLEKLELLDEGWRELEQGQLDVIRNASQAQRQEAAREPTRLNPIYAHMDPKEEFQARKLIDSSPDKLYEAADRLLARSPGFFSDEEDAIFDAIIELRPTRRRAFFIEHILALSRLLSMSRFKLMESLATGTEVQALIARLREATEWRIDDMTAVAATVDRAVALLQERARIRATIDTLPAPARAEAQARLDELQDLDELFQFNRVGGGQLGGTTFLGMLSGARADPSAFAADAARLAQFVPRDQARQTAFEIAKQRILLAGSDVRAIQAALVGLHAPAPGAPAEGGAPARSPAAAQAEDEQLRRDVLADPAVAAVIRWLPGSDRMMVDSTVRAEAFDAKLGDLNHALVAAAWGRFFSLVLEISRNDQWNRRFRDTAPEPFGTYANVHGDQRRIMEKILRTKRVPLADMLTFFGFFTGGVEGFVLSVEDIDEDDRSLLRQGYALTTHPPIGPPTRAQNDSIDAYRKFESQLRRAYGESTESYQHALWAVLGSVPTGDDWATGEGRFRAAQFMYDQEQARLALLGSGVAQYFTEADETMVVAAREFTARFEPLRPRGTLEAVDLAALSSLHERFLGRATEFTEASNAISDMAGMVAATVAGVVVIAATGGAATPAVIAAAAAAGAGSRVVTKEMFGGAYADVGARDVLLGAVDGALAVVGASLAAKGAQLVGLGGHALTAGAARVGGEVAAEASEVAGRSGVTLARRVAGSAVEAALDGAFSGAISDAFSTMTSPGTWRRGVWRGLVQVGESALVAGLTGLITGGLVGAALPVVGAGLSRISEAIAMRGIESTLTRAGPGALEVLGAARRAAAGGDVVKVNRLLGELEKHLSAGELRTLRRNLYEDLQATLRRPPGTANPANEAEGHLLADSATIDDGHRLDRAQRDAEMDVVRRSEPRPSTVEGYVDEVDLGNGHTWRRRENGTWCRFSDPTLCGADIPGAAPMSAAEAASVRGERVAGMRTRLTEYGARPGRAQQAADLQAALDAAVARGDAEYTDRITESIEEILANERLPTRGETFSVDMHDPRVLRAFDEALASPALEGNPEWNAYQELVRERYIVQGHIEIGHTSARPPTDEVRAQFLAGMRDGTALPEAAELTRVHLDRAVRRAGGSQAGAVTAGDVIWIDAFSGARLPGPGPNAVLWPADPVWGVWRLDHIVERRHGGLDVISNYIAAPQNMHATKTSAMDRFGRAAEALE